MNTVLITGSQGSGKTTLARLIARALLMHPHYQPTSVKVSDPGSTGETTIGLGDTLVVEGRVELTEIVTTNGGPTIAEEASMSVEKFLALHAFARAAEKMVITRLVDGAVDSLIDISATDIESDPESFEPEEIDAFNDFVDARNTLYDLGLLTEEDNKIGNDGQPDPVEGTVSEPVVAPTKMISVDGVADAYEAAKRDL